MIINNFKKFFKSELQLKIAKGVVWSFLGTFISKGFVLLAFMIIARFFPVQDYGKVGIIKSFISTFTLFSLGSFGVTATKYLAIYREDNKIKASEILSLTRLSVLISAIFILLVVLMFSGFVSESILGDSNLVPEVKISSIAIFFASLNGFQLGALSGLERFKLISIINIINGLLSLPVIILLAYYFGVFGVVSGLAIVNFFLWLTSAIFLQKEVKKENIHFTLNNFKANLTILKHFSLPSFLSSLMLSPVILTCNSLLVNNSKDGFAQMGYYDAAYNFSFVVITLNMVIGQVFYPYSMKLFGKENKKFEYFNIILPWAIGVFIGIPVLLFPDLFSMLFGLKYNNTTMHITITFVVIFTMIISQRQGIARNFAAANYMWWSLFGNFVWGILAITSTYFLTDYGATGRSLAFLIAYALNTIMFIPFYINKELLPKKLIFNKFNYLILLFVVISSTFFYLNDNYILRVIFLFFSLLFVLKFFIGWKNEFIR